MSAPFLEKLPAAVRDTSRPFDERARALIAEMTLDEKISQMVHDAPAIERLGIQAHNWWNECSHGVARAGLTTVFPMPIGMAATWNIDLITRMGQVVSDEARAKHHEAARRGHYGDYYGLTHWTPNINIFRDPRWGRGQETYGEDPYLTAGIAVAYIRALQGDHPTYYKLTATAKHFAAHSGPEAKRHEFNADVSEYDLWDTYLPAFEACVKEAKVESIMGAYSRTNGESCSASPTLLTKILRERWGFTGHVVSDCWAITDVYKYHGIVETPVEAAALALNAGCDMECGCCDYATLQQALDQGLVDMATIDRALERLMIARFRLGMFDPPEQVPYAQIPYEVVASPPHIELARHVARESMVLLKNEGDLLPLAKTLRSVGVVGANADEVEVLLGNYHGEPRDPVTILEGIRRAVSAETQVIYAKGFEIASENTDDYARALHAAQNADVVIFVGGLSQVLEGEDQQDEGVPAGTRSQGDRTYIELPPVQENLLKALHATGKPIVLVLVNGSALAIPWADAHIPAIVEAWYPGQAGDAVADVLFGDYNPAGRLPITVYKSLDDVPPFEDYSMRGRTYRYFAGEPLYAFGHGLSYTRFGYRNIMTSSQTISEGGLITVSVDITNIGTRDGDEVVQLYLEPTDAKHHRATRTLQGFTRIHLASGETRTVQFTLSARQFARIDERNEHGEPAYDSGGFTVFIGGFQPHFAPFAEAISSCVVQFVSPRG
jgi:beta-glucosidase